MRVVVVYESMFGNTRKIAAAVAEAWADAQVVPVATIRAEDVRSAALLLVGAPTHAFGLSRPSTRRSAGEMAAKPGSGLDLETGWDGRGVREWLAGSEQLPRRAAVFDTRARFLPLTGHASRAIARRLRRRGTELIAPPTSFLVGRDNRLAAGEIDRARSWAAGLAQRLRAAGADAPAP